MGDAMKKAIIGTNAHVWLCTSLMDTYIGFAAALEAFNKGNTK